jgi:hypothetical protein
MGLKVYVIGIFIEIVSRTPQTSFRIIAKTFLAHVD